MVWRLIELPLVALKLLMFRICVQIGISKIDFFNFSGTESVKENQRNLKTIQNLLILSFHPFPSNIKKFPIFFLVFYSNLNPFPPCALLGGSQLPLTFEQSYLKNGQRKHCLFPENYLNNIQHTL